MLSDRKENLIKNTALFALGNLGSKLLQVVLVPYYTRVMTSEEFGTTDILQAVVALLMPIFSFTIYEGVFRYAMEQDFDRKSVFSTGVLISGLGALVLCLVGAVCSIFLSPIYVWLVVANTVAVIFRSLLSQYTRAINRIGLFTADNLLITVFVLMLNFFFITELQWGIEGYILGYTLANVLSCVLLAICLGHDRKVSVKSLDGFLMQEMLLFSAPLIPNAICWWISSFADRIIITTQLGGAANGLYAAAHKIPSLLTVLVTVFFQAWQISANEEFKKKDISIFYTEIHDQIFASVALISSALILLCRPITDVFLGASYESAWLYMPVLLVAMTFFSFAQFLGSIYSANKHTGMALVTNFVAVVVNLLLNIVLVPKVGVLGAGIATAISYFVLWMIRVKDTRKIVEIRYRKLPMTLAVLILIGQTVLMSLEVDATLTYVICAAGTLLLIVLFWKTFAGLFRFIGKLFKKIAGYGAG